MRFVDPNIGDTTVELATWVVAIVALVVMVVLMLWR